MTRTDRDLSDREVAQALRKSVRTVQRWCASGRLSGAYKAGRSWRIPRATLDRPYRAAVDRAGRGQLDEAIDELNALSKKLPRLTDEIAGANLPVLERLLRALEPVNKQLLAVGKQSSERRRRLR